MAAKLPDKVLKVYYVGEWELRRSRNERLRSLFAFIGELGGDGLGFGIIHIVSSTIYIVLLG